MKTVKEKHPGTSADLQAKSGASILLAIEQTADNQHSVDFVDLQSLATLSSIPELCKQIFGTKAHSTHLSFNSNASVNSGSVCFFIHGRHGKYGNSF